MDTKHPHVLHIPGFRLHHYTKVIFGDVYAGRYTYIIYTILMVRLKIECIVVLHIVDSVGTCDVSFYRA